MPLEKPSRVYKIETADLVRNYSVAEYFRKKGLENPPDIEFIVVPLLHGGRDCADKLIKLIDEENPDIILHENAAAYYGWKGDEISQNEFDPNNLYSYVGLTFLGPVLKYCASKGIPHDTFEYKHRTIAHALKFHRILVDNLKRPTIPDIDISNEYERWDIKGALEKIIVAVSANKESDFDAANEERESRMLGEIGPRSLELYQSTPELQQKGKIKILLWIGAMHGQPITGAMKSRGDKVSLKPLFEYVDPQDSKKAIQILASKLFRCFMVENNIDAAKQEHDALKILNKHNVGLEYLLTDQYPKELIRMIEISKNSKTPYLTLLNLFEEYIISLKK